MLSKEEEEEEEERGQCIYESGSDVNRLAVVVMVVVVVEFD